MVDIFQQASRDMISTRIKTMSSESYVYKGVKIEMDDDGVRIFNTKGNGDYYVEISSMEYSIFKDKGWKLGCYVISISNNRRILNKINEKISSETNLNRIQSISRYRDTIINKFLETIKLLQDEIRREL